MPDNRPKPSTPEDSPSFAAPQQPAKAPAQPAKSWYLVLHGAVGQWAQDAVISSDDLTANVHDKDGNLIGTTPVDIDRLLRLGAIQPTQEPIKDVLPLADDDN